VVEFHRNRRLDSQMVNSGCGDKEGCLSRRACWDRHWHGLVAGQGAHGGGEGDRRRKDLFSAHNRGPVGSGRLPRKGSIGALLCLFQVIRLTSGGRLDSILQVGLFPAAVLAGTEGGCAGAQVEGLAEDPGGAARQGPEAVAGGRG